VCIATFDDAAIVPALTYSGMVFLAKGMLLRKAAQILRDERGIQWDAEIVDAFLRSIAERLAEEARASADPSPAVIVRQGGMGTQAG
jgi:HD-GYP domain-containing protein (c-di-GMP phosphodiesterase class II)